MTAPTRLDVTKHLLQLRAVLAVALKTTNAERYNDAKTQIAGLDAQLAKFAPEVEQIGAAARLRMAPKITRAQMRAAKRSQGNTFTQHMMRKVSRG